MQRTLISSRGHAALAMLIVILCSGTASDASADDPEVGPASLVTLSSSTETAEYVLRDDALKPRLGPVLLAGAAEGALAIVVGIDPLEVFSTEMPGGCQDEGVIVCCDRATGTLFFSATYGIRSGWVRTGQLCEATLAAEDGILFDPLPAAVSDELASRFGVSGCFIRAAKMDGTLRVLVNAPSKDSWRWFYCFNELSELEDTSKDLAAVTRQSSAPWLGLSDLQRASRGGNPAVILANHYNGKTPPLPNAIRDAPPACNCCGTETVRCHKYTHHWFIKSGTGSNVRWTSSTNPIDRCTCPATQCPSPPVCTAQ